MHGLDMCVIVPWFFFFVSLFICALWPMQVIHGTLFIGSAEEIVFYANINNVSRSGRVKSPLPFCGHTNLHGLNSYCSF